MRIGLTQQTAALPLLVVISLLIGSCTRRSSINVAVVFATTWTLAGESLQQEDRSVVREAVLVTLRRAFDGYAVRFAQAARGDRTVRVEDTPYTYNANARLYAAGMTYPLSTTSMVRIDVLFSNELVAAHCSDLEHCRMTRADILQGLGRGVGATAAHELGHQLGFIVDTDCDDCYDSRVGTSYAHFFGDQHWSDRVVPRMRQVLPRE